MTGTMLRSRRNVAPKHAGRATRGSSRCLLLALALPLELYGAVIRPRLLRWGATDEEVNGVYPGAEIIPNGVRNSTMAVTIDAPPSRVWPWLVQMGYGRAGWYSWDRLDNWGARSSEELHPEWQRVAPGDILPVTPDGTVGFRIAALEPERFLALRASFDLRGRPFDPSGPHPRYYTDSTWCFFLRELPGNRTRVVESGYARMKPRRLLPLFNALLFEPAHWIMQTRQFANLKRLAECTPPATPGVELPEMAPAEPVEV